MSIMEAASMLRKKVNRNDRPYTQAVVKGNNDLVDDWYETVLKKICDKKGMVPAMHIESSIRFYIEGRETQSFISVSPYIPRVTDEQIDYWIRFFRQPIEDIHRAGAFVTKLGWDILTGALKTYYAREKWEHVYSQSPNPLDWEKMFNEYPSLISGDPLPYNLDREEVKDMEMKVRTILNIRIEPSK